MVLKEVLQLKYARNGYFSLVWPKMDYSGIKLRFQTPKQYISELQNVFTALFVVVLIPPNAKLDLKSTYIT